MTSEAASALNTAAQALYDSGRNHKKLEQHHRRQARQLMQQVEALRDEAAKHGINLNIDKA